MDRKRINGPDHSVIPLPLDTQNEIKPNPEILNSYGKRLDDRNLESVRPLCTASERLDILMLPPFPLRSSFEKRTLKLPLVRSRGASVTYGD
jgi:hypothetical protein